MAQTTQAHPRPGGRQTTQTQPRPGGRPPAGRMNLIKCIIIAVVVLLVLLGLAFLITWLTMKPKRPIFAIETATVQNYVLTNDDHLNAKFGYVIKSYNPDKRISIKYYKMEVSTVHRNQTVGYTKIPRFAQRPRNETMINANLVAKNVALSQYNAKDLRAEKKGGEVELDVYVKARVRYKVGIWRSRKRTLRAFCSPIMVNVTTSKSFGRTYCQVKY